MRRLDTAAIAAMLAVALAANLAVPLATYVVTLALFGMPHVFVELRYVDQRFGSRLRESGSTAWLAAVLGAVVVLTALGAAGYRVPHEAAFRLGLVVPLVLVADYAAGVRAGAGLRTVAALLLGTCCVVGGLLDPLLWLVGFACLHNLSPLWFLYERLGGRVMLLAGPVFLLVPLLILAAGSSWARPSWNTPPEWNGIASESLLAAFVPAGFGGTAAASWFRACVFLQCAHYVFVLWVLPRLGPGPEARPLAAWPAPRSFVLGVFGLGLLGAAGFLVDFGAKRSHYAVPAALHAWLEVPVLILTLRWNSSPGAQPSCLPS